ncbi:MULTISPECIES: 1,4-alpha-glucan branching protein GlgB [Clostridia]|uniref:1,4-alpha-glucan branching enzyme n=2 Tax=Clostridia TaxID=186801 RepID=A0A8I0ADW5_9CLOT|nr:MULTISPECIES: 1,4-alpha-glucan branching protein GlgB [Clostridia]MBC5639980.1 1,4-alpha-glucan branching protein GlgB [Clostridium lentum]MBC5653750.1 1,4-alpha-glucan branching protein GlgB [Blautia lenta]OKZ85974.1 MAG: 1,4-alpha-glucan branching enzyme [Clostridium sp. 29_15]
MNIQDFYIGKSFDAYEFFGAHKIGNKILFRVYAPNAAKVSLVGEFNDWQEEEMEQQYQSGIYSITSENARVGMMYKYCIHTRDGQVVYHCDPYGFAMELRPNSASYIVDLEEYKFSDDEWMNKRDKCYNKPLNIYEIHMGSWMKKNDETYNNGWYRYNEIADRLINYVKENGFTHIEIMPLCEHPVDCSWGYQNTGFFSPTSRYGTNKELKELIDKCHKANVGVILDFVPIHFAVDDYGLAKFDGTELYEYPHKDVGASEWGTCNFIHSRGEVCSFLQSAANYWLKEYHFDGLRMDAISRAIYWQGNPARGVNSCAINFIRNMNVGLHKLHPTAMIIAEDSTAYPKVTAPVEYNGLGFDYKWDLGWMNDTLEYFKISPKERPNHYYKLTFSMEYFYNELFLLPFSHDEVVHGKATIIQKMWGDYEDKFKQCRALYMYMYTHPGKKLNFMGNEIAQFREWDEKREQDWQLIKMPLHYAFNKYIKRLNEVYDNYEALYKNEYDSSYFKWLEVNAPEKSVYIYERGRSDHRIIVALNFSDNEYAPFTFKVEEELRLREIVNSDSDIYGGSTWGMRSDVTTTKEDNYLYNLSINLKPFSGIIYEVVND